jgi:hypothetical protein
VVREVQPRLVTRADLAGDPSTTTSVLGLSSPGQELSEE